MRSQSHYSRMFDICISFFTKIYLQARGDGPMRWRCAPMNTLSLRFAGEKEAWTRSLHRSVRPVAEKKVAKMRPDLWTDRRKTDTITKENDEREGIIMLQSEVRAGSWILTQDGQILASHTVTEPFVTAIRREKTYKESRGTYKETVLERERIPLYKVKKEGEEIVFSAEGHSLALRVESRPHGAELFFRGEAGWSYAFTLPAIEGEAVFGGGEQYRKTDLRGERVKNFVSEHITATTILEKAVVPRALYREKKHASIGSYAPMPVFVTDTGRIIRFDTASDGYADFGKDAYSFVYDACPASLTLQKGSSYREIAALLSAQVPGRQYLPDWCLDGMILGAQGGREAVLEKTFSLLDQGAEICGVWSQDWSGCNKTIMGYQVWWNWEADESLYPDLKGMIEELRARGVRFLAYINPYLVKDSRLYTYCKDKGYLIRKRDGSIYHIKSTTFDAGMLDLTDPEAVRYIKDVLIKQNMLDLGVSGWMADFGEYLPLDCVLHEGDPALLHDQWPVLWAKVNREAIEEYGKEDVFFFSRSGYTGIQTYAPILWNGDQHTDTTKDYGMPCVMPASFSLGFSGAPMVHCDIGGFFSFGKMKRSEELFTRWMEMCTFSLLMRSHESIRPWANAQPYSEGVRPYTVRLTRIHKALKPYIAHCVHQASQGLPVLRPDFWEEMDHKAGRDMYAYFLGDELFVCPMLKEGADRRRVWLPKGKWVHFWTGETYKGGKKYRVDAPLGQTPVFYRKDGVFAELFEEAAAKARESGGPEK